MSLSSRGLGFARMEPNIREAFGGMTQDTYHAQHNPNGIINMGIAENYAMIPDLVDFMNQTNPAQYSVADLTYGEGPWGRDRLRSALAKFMTKTMKAVRPVQADDLTIVNGCTPLFDSLGLILADPGDAILFPTPVYSAFQADFGMKAKVECIFVGMQGIDQFGVDCIARFEKAFLKAQQEGKTVRALMLCNPHNPLGQCYTREAIVGLMRFCQKYGMHLLSDEVYAASIYDVPGEVHAPYISVLSFDTAPYIAPDLLHVVYGLSKDFAGGGLRIGVFHSTNRLLCRALGQISQFTWCGSPSEKAALTILEDEAFLTRFMTLSRERLSVTSMKARAMLDDAGIKYSRGANAGFFLWADFRPFLNPKIVEVEGREQAEMELAERLQAQKVYLTPGQSQFAAEAGFFRIVFSHDEETLVEGFARIRKALGVGVQSDGHGT